MRAKKNANQGGMVMNFTVRFSREKEVDIRYPVVGQTDEGLDGKGKKRSRSQ